MKNIFVGNLSSETTPEAVISLFEPLGTVRKFKLMTDRHTGLSRGFAFVWMKEIEAGPAIAALDGTTVDGHAIEVRAGREQVHRDSSTAPKAPRSSDIDSL
jgi:RNA recognition motif-containing protein